MIVYQVVFRNQKCRIRKIKVLGVTPTGFRVAGPVAFWPSGKNTFRRLRDAKAYLQAAGVKDPIRPGVRSSLTIE